VASWAASPQAPTTLDEISERGFARETLREIVFSTAGGSMVRVRLTNLFGRRPLDVGRAAVGLAGSGAEVAAGTSQGLTFAGQSSVVLAPGAEVLSDPVALETPPLSRLAVSLYLPRGTGPATQHVDAHEINYVASGSHVLDAGGAFTRQIGDWFFLDGVDVLAPHRDIGTLIALGDSITAGVGSTTDSDANWPDDLARRLAALPGETLSVVDAGIGGNRVLHDSPCCGVNAIARFGHDAAAQPGARDVILLEGVNDIGYSQKHGAVTAPHTNVSASQIIAGDEEIIAEAHRAGLLIFGATITPFRGARYWTAAGEAKREAVNHWILTSGAFDGVINFAAVLADPGHPERLNPLYDSGDGLHPNDAGYQAMADAVNLRMLLRRA
jgi:lysophospholipase L1-like esterase